MRVASLVSRYLCMVGQQSAGWLGPCISPSLSLSLSLSAHSRLPSSMQGDEGDRDSEQSSEASAAYDSVIEGLRASSLEAAFRYSCCGSFKQAVAVAYERKDGSYAPCGLQLPAGEAWLASCQHRARTWALTGAALLRAAGAVQVTSSSRWRTCWRPAVRPALAAARRT